jgi:hypothetical protein
VDIAMIRKLLDLARTEEAKVGFRELFSRDNEVLETSSEMCKTYPAKGKSNSYDESQDGLKVLLILLVVSWKRSVPDVRSFIAALSVETEQFGGAIYRLGAIIFGTQSTPVSRPAVRN